MQQLMKASPSAKPAKFLQPDRSRRTRFRRHRLDILALPVGLGLLISLWAFIAWLGDYPAFILPDPLTVSNELATITMNGVLWHHARATLAVVMSGLLLGVSVAIVLGYLLAKSPLLERLTGPYIVATQSVPAIAIAPLLVIWFGAGHLSKVLICALIVFFPILVNTIVGLRSVDPGLSTLMRSLRANRWQTFIMLEVPAAMPVLLGGLKIWVTLSVICAVVGEFVGAERGLGYLINLSKGLFNTPLLFASLIALSVISLALYLLISSLEHWLLAWQK